MGWDGSDVKIFDHFAKFLSCYYAVASAGTIHVYNAFRGKKTRYAVILRTFKILENEVLINILQLLFKDFLCYRGNAHDF